MPQRSPGDPPRVLVVGAGMSGLLAAHRLRQLGVAATVLEATARPGGGVRTRREGEWVLEAGPGFAPAVPAEVETLLTLGGLPAGDRIALSPLATRRFLVHDGRPVAVPETAAEMVASPLLSVPGRLRLLKEPFVGRGEPDPEESALSFAARRFGAEMAARFIDPVVSAGSGGDPSSLLASRALPQLVALERRAGSILKGRMQAARRARREGRTRVARPSWSCAGGLEVLPQRLAAALGKELHLGDPVVTLQRTSTGWRVATASGGEQHGEGLLLAVGVDALRRVTEGLPGADDLAALATIPHASLVTISLGFRREDVGHPLDGHGVLTAMADRSLLRSVVFASSLLADRAPAGHVLLAARLGGVHHPGVTALTDADLVAAAVETLTPLLGIAGPPVLGAVDRWGEAMPLAVAGHGAAIAGVERFEASIGAVTCCGSWRDGLGLGAAMQGGVGAAGRLVDLLGWSDPAAVAPT